MNAHWHTATRALMNPSDELLEGVRYVSRPVLETMGPRGRYVVIVGHYGPPMVTRDGVTVARSIRNSVKDDHLRAGTQFAQIASERVNARAGDGTTTVVLLVERLLSRAREKIKEGYNPLAIADGVLFAANETLKHLSKIVVPLVPEDVPPQERSKVAFERLRQIASITAYDEEIASFVLKAFELVGMDGTITIKEAPGQETRVEVKEGYAFDRSAVSERFVNDLQYYRCRLPALGDDPNKNVAVFLFDGHLGQYLEDDLDALVKIYSWSMESGQPIVLIAKKFHQEVIRFTVTNVMERGLNAVLVEAPGAVDTMKREMLSDISMLTGAKVFDHETYDMKNWKPEDLGQVALVISYPPSRSGGTILVGASPDKVALDAYINGLEDMMRSATAADREVYKMRIAALRAGIATIYVGAETDVAARQRRMRYEDALHACRGAIDHGVLYGGGRSLQWAAEQLQVLGYPEQDPGYFVGIDIFKEAASDPMRRLLQNCGVRDDRIEEVVAELKSNADPDVGIVIRTAPNVFAEEPFYVGNVVDAGIWDPASVTFAVIETGTEIADVSIRAGALLLLYQEEEVVRSQPPHG